MKSMRSGLLVALAAFLTVPPAVASTKLLVTVVESKSGKPVTDLKAAEFVVLDDKTPRRVEAAEFSAGNMDVMMLLDTGLAGEMVRPLADSLIEQLQPKEQMAIVSYHSSADLIQDYTSSHDLLKRAVGSVKYGNNPQLLDALYAAIDGGFQNTTFRRVLVILTTGYEGRGRVGEKEVLKLARRNSVSIFPVYMVGAEKSMFENLARQTGGASFNVRDMRKTLTAGPGARIFEVLRSYYTVTVTGNLSLSERLKVDVQRAWKPSVSALPIE